MFCPKCGHNNKPNANFCRKCGNKLNMIPKDISAVDFYGNKIESKNTVNNPTPKKTAKNSNSLGKVGGGIFTALSVPFGVVIFAFARTIIRELLQLLTNNS